jgi:predicted dinucleotide-binding enzyme
VVVANSRGPATLAQLARETGAKPVEVSDVPRGRDLVVVTIPEGKIPDLPAGLFKDAPDNLIVIDTGNYPRAKSVVMELVDEMGFDPVDAGGLDESWRQQPGTPVYATDLDAAGVRRALAQASPERKPEWRAMP